MINTNQYQGVTINSNAFFYKFTFHQGVSLRAGLCVTIFYGTIFSILKNSVIKGFPLQSLTRIYKRLNITSDKLAYYGF